MAEITGDMLVRARDAGRALADAQKAVKGGARGPIELSAAAVLAALPQDLRQLTPAVLVRELVGTCDAAARARWGELSSLQIPLDVAPTFAEKVQLGHRPGLEVTAVVTRGPQLYPAWAKMTAEEQLEGARVVEAIHRARVKLTPLQLDLEHLETLSPEDLATALTEIASQEFGE